MYRKRTLPSSFTNSPYTPPRKRSTTINLARPSYYRTNYQYQQYLKRKNQRTAGLVGKELKFYDSRDIPTLAPATTWTHLSPSTTGCLNCPAQGAGAEQRIGRKITGTMLHIKGYLSVDANTASQGGIVRLVVFRDKQTNSAVVAAGTPFETTGNTRVVDFRDLEQVQRFDILIDRTFAINPVDFYNGSAVQDNRPHIPFNFNIKTP